MQMYFQADFSLRGEADPAGWMVERNSDMASACSVVISRTR